MRLMPLARVLAGMECEGFALDAQALRDYGGGLTTGSMRRTRRLLNTRAMTSTSISQTARRRAVCKTRAASEEKDQDRLLHQC